MGKTHQNLLVAGRHGIVDWVALRGELTTAMGGTLMIAEISLNKQICHQMRLPLAVWEVASYRPTAEEPVPPEVTGDESSWDDVRDLLKRKQVRVLAGDLDYWLRPIMKHLREKYSVNLGAWAAYDYEDEEGFMSASSFMLVIGPLLKLKISHTAKDPNTRGDGGEAMRPHIKANDLDIAELAPAEPMRTRGNGVDWTREWPRIFIVRQKAPSPSWGVRKLSHD